MSLPSLLIIDPDLGVLEPLRAELRGRARVEGTSSFAEGLTRLKRGDWAAVLLSLDFPAVDLAVVHRLLEAGTAGDRLALCSAQPTAQIMVEASRMGLAGVFETPVDGEALWDALRDVLLPPEEVIPIDPEPGEDETVIGRSPAILEVFRVIGRVAGSAATVLITGESGTGKEMVARELHRHSDRSRGPFVAINCAAIPENLLESELFGHEKGAFTGAIARKIGRFERAHGGTLFLDEIGDMSLALQAKILRAVQEREIERVGGEERIRVDVRVVAATNKDLRAAIADGSFREDLYYRLAVVTLQLPRLIHRGTDLEMLTRHFVARFSVQYGRGITGISRGVFERMHQHDWPGNVRELRNVLERAVLMAQGSVLRAEHLPLDQAAPSTGGSELFTQLPGYTPDMTVAEVEALHIREVLRRVGGHMGRASEVLGVHRNTLTRKVREYGLEASVS